MSSDFAAAGKQATKEKAQLALPDSAGPAPHHNLRRVLAAGSFVIVCLVLLMSWRSIHQSNLQHRELTYTRAGNISQVLDRYIAGVIDKIDLALSSVVYEYESHMYRRGGETLEIDTLLQQQVKLLPEVDSIRIATADGIVRFGTGGVQNVSVADREYFKHARESRLNELTITGPVVGRISGKWVVTFSRRLHRPDGSFAGVVFATLTSEYFEKIFSEIDLGEHGAISLRAADLRLVARHPEPAGAPNAIGSNKVSPQLVEALQSAPIRGTYVAPAALDGIERVNAYRRVADYPFYVIVGIATGNWFASGHNGVTTIVALGGACISLTLLFSWLLHAMWRRRELAELELARINRMLEELAVRDVLTGLYNRRYLSETITREFARADRDRHAVGVILLDIDFFKNVNDTYGHKAGDRVLQAVGGLLRENTRGGDLACRHGGEEFLLVLPNASAAMARQRAEQLRSEVEQLRVHHDGAELRVTISAGIATYPEDGRDGEEIIRRADAALYAAKAAGRNCVRAALKNSDE